MIATADGNSLKNEKFYTAAEFPRDELKSITIENLIFIRAVEIIFCLKDLLNNQNNYGWLNQSKNLLIIDFSIDFNKININPTPAKRMLNDRLPEFNRLSLDKLAQNFKDLKPDVRQTTLRGLLEPSIDSFVKSIEITEKAMAEFVVTCPFAFNDKDNECLSFTTNLVTTNTSLNQIHICG